MPRLGPPLFQLYTKLVPLLLVGVLFFCGLTVYHFHRLKIDFSPERLSKGKSDLTPELQKKSELFSDKGEPLVFVKRLSDGNVYEDLRSFKDLHHLLSKFPDSRSSHSLFNTDMVTRVDDRNVEIKPPFEKLPSAPEKIDQVLNLVQSKPVFKNILISRDNKKVSFHLNSTFKSLNRDESQEIYLKNVQEAANESIKKKNNLFYFGGLLSEAKSLQLSWEEIKLFAPLGVLIVGSLLYFFYGTFFAVSLPIIVNVISIILTYGLMILLSIPLDMMNAFFPILVFALGTTEDVHLLNSISKFHASKSISKREGRLLEVIKDIGLATILTSMTTTIGFAALTFNDNQFMVDYGKVLASSMVINFFVTTICFSFVLLFSDIQVKQEKASSLIARLRKKVGEFTIRYSKYIYFAPAFLVVTLLFIPQIRLATGPWVIISEKHPIMREITEFSESFFGVGKVDIYLRLKDNGTFLNPDNLELLYQTYQHFESFPEISRTSSFAHLIQEIHEGFAPSEDINLPYGATEAANEFYVLSLRKEQLKNYIDYDYREAKISLYHYIPDGTNYLSFMERIDESLEEIKKNHDLDIQRISQEEIYHNKERSFFQNNVLTIISVIFVSAIVILITLRSIKATFFFLIANLGPFLVTVFSMWCLNIPFDFGGQLVSIFVFGIIIDDTVHVLVRAFRKKSAPAEIIKTEFRPLTATTVSTVVMAGMLSFSSLMPVHHLGILCFFLLSSAYFFDLIWIPAVLKEKHHATI